MATELVDASKLDACCTAEANAIRAKTGSSSQIAYDWANSKGFADAITAIPSGGGTEFKEYAEGTLQTINDPTITTLRTNVFRFLSSLQTVILASVISTTGDRHFESCNNLQEISIPELQVIPNQFLLSCSSLITFNGKKVVQINTQALSNTRMANLVFPAYNGSIGGSACEKNPNLTIADFNVVTTINANAFYNDSAFNTLIIRNPNTVAALSNINAFSGTPFANGGTGGTIYISETLYNHLGDGTAYDYKAASNWSTVDGYGTITWAKIEGSYYETHYADGTVIS